jgi:hypothetical protein
MNPRFLLLGIASIVLVMSGCTRKSHDVNEHYDPATQVGVTFSAKQGLSVPPETAKFIGLQVAEVEERSTPRQWRTSVSNRGKRQFAPTATSLVLASAFVSPAQAALLTNGQAAIVCERCGAAKWKSST